MPSKMSPRRQNSPPPAEPFDIHLRAFAKSASRKQAIPWARQSLEANQDYQLIFDTETLAEDTDTHRAASQALRFGAYQLIEKGECVDCGFFYDPDTGVLRDEEIETLRQGARSLSHKLITRNEFVHELLFATVDAGGMIVGFNLPFDLSRVALSADTARRARNKETQQLSNIMQGAFTFEFSCLPHRPRLQIKHQSKRAAFYRFTRESDLTPRSEKKKGRENLRDEGFFLDLKTLGSALLGQSVTLSRLTKALDTPTKKEKLEHYGVDSARRCPAFVAHQMSASCLGSMGASTAERA